MIHFLPQNNAHKYLTPSLLWHSNYCGVKSMQTNGILEFDTYIVSSNTQATNKGQVAEESKIMLVIIPCMHI